MSLSNTLTLIGALFTTAILIILNVIKIDLLAPLRRRYHIYRLKKYYGDKHWKYHLSNLDPKHIQNYPPPHMPAVYEIVSIDNTSVTSVLKKDLKVVSWNIEFGYKLSGIIQRLKELDPDIILLQEVDIAYIHKEGTKSCFELICSELNYAGVFAAHYEYEHDKGKGVWGCSILSKFPIVEPHQVCFEDVITGYGRSAIGAKIIPRDASGDLHPLLVYSVHTEVCTGIRARIKQIDKVLSTAIKERGALFEEYSSLPHIKWESPKDVPIVIGGDFNTTGHGICRISPVHCLDEYRLLSLGTTEAEWWQHNIFSDPNHLGFGFYDPFDKTQSTLNHPLHTAKMDWLLLSKSIQTDHCEIGENTFSDHYHISVKFVLDRIE